MLWYVLPVSPPSPCLQLSVNVSWFSSGSLKAARAASTVLCNMFQYRKLHRDYKLVRPTTDYCCLGGRFLDLIITVQNLSRFLLMSTIKLMEDEMISKRHEVKDDTLPLHFKQNHVLFSSFTFQINRKGKRVTAKDWARCTVNI